MTYTAIDGDISDFLDAQLELTDEFRTDELLTYLENAGHDKQIAADAVRSWQKERMIEIHPERGAFSLTPAGLAAVEELRNRVLVDP